ncbi:hypothetical protein SAMN04487977_101572 [Treponema bryantii]|uniref:Uncharacterized protein n=1 Tax=Treponema bryantii TaxID=163 RepID=A0A1H9B4Y2_9SPIR|nr:hypothetical protein [Treponema bryantii]SEP83787.1 hypothetical protein SAMN04487977_101572 [Treponema bryantii]
MIYSGFRLRESAVETIDCTDLAVIKVPTTDESGIQVQSIHFHEDLRGLIWFADSPVKNIDPKQFVNKIETESVTLEFTIPGYLEPSMIFTSEPVEFSDSADEPLLDVMYYDLDPQQKGEYLKFLQNPYEHTDISYLMLLYHGLERHLWEGNWRKAVNVILKLRYFHKDKIFLDRSCRALLLTAIKKDCGEIALALIEQSHGTNIPITEYFLCASSFNLHITSTEIVRYASWFGVDSKLNRNKITENIKKLVGREYLLVSDVLSDEYIQNMPLNLVKIFDNTSLRDAVCSIPLFNQDYKMRNIIQSLCEQM